MRPRVRVGTRRSPLARAQTDAVLAELARVAPGFRFEAAPVDTSGDKDRSIASSPDFTDTIDRALLRGEVDLAVHSAKDLSVELDPRFSLLACPRRGDPRDCLVLGAPSTSPRLPRGARVGSSSPRRRAQLLRYRPDLRVVEVRGNVDTRIGLVRAGTVEAVMLAVAGVVRLGRGAEIGRILPTEEFLPAPAQGALALVGRAEEAPLQDAVRRLDDAATHAAVLAERRFAATLGGDCQLPLGALAVERAGSIFLRGEVLALDGRGRLRGHRRGPARDAARVGDRLARDLLDRGAADLLGPGRG